MMAAIMAMAAQAVLQVPSDMPLPDPDEFRSSEEVVWDGKEGKYILYADSIFAVTENGKKLRHVVVRQDHKWGTHTSATLIDCKKKTWRNVWFTETGAETETYVARRNYAIRAANPPVKSPMGAVIERVCRQS